MNWRALLFPDPPRRLPYARAWNIGFRTAHIAVMGILVGGHVFEVAPTRLLPWLYATLATGTGLVIIEAWSNWQWVYQGRGVAVLLKLALLGLIPWAWSIRVPILIVVIVLASVSAHMPARFRYYSVLHGKLLHGKLLD